MGHKYRTRLYFMYNIEKETGRYLHCYVYVPCCWRTVNQLPPCTLAEGPPRRCSCPAPGTHPRARGRFRRRRPSPLPPWYNNTAAYTGNTISLSLDVIKLWFVLWYASMQIGEHGNILRRSLDIDIGVPHGTVLGPIISKYNRATKSSRIVIFRKAES